MNDDVFDLKDEPADKDYEKLSYGKAEYKRIQRLRRKGKRRRIDVPPLLFELTKPEKPRIAFWIIAVVSVVLFLGVIVGIGFLYNEMVKLSSSLSGIGDFLKVVFSPDILSASFGWSALPGLLLGAVYLLVLMLFLVPIILLIYFYRYVRDAFYMAKCSKEEFARGSFISSRIFELVCLIIVVTVICIFLLSYLDGKTAKIYVGIIFAGVVFALGGFLALIIVERVKNNKWFEGLDEDKKQNYIAHEKALRRVGARLNRERTMWSNLGK